MSNKINKLKTVIKNYIELDNQIKLIETIYKSYVKNNTDDDPESLLTLISNVLARPINQLSELTYLETITIVDHFKLKLFL